MDNMIAQFTTTLGGSLPSLLAALLIFILGWIIAGIAASLVRKILSGMNVNDRINQSSADSKGLDIERVASRLVFWFILLFAIAGALEKLNLDMVSTPLANLLNQVTSFIPSLIGAIVIGLVGWLVATVARTGLQKLLDSTTLDDKLASEAGVPPLSNTLSNLVYWFIILLFIPMVLAKLGMNSILDPVLNLVDKVSNFLPNLFTGAAIAFVGYIVARIIRGLVTNVVATLSIDSIVEKSGLAKANIANMAGTVVFLFIMVPTIVAALDALRVEAISRPAINMLDQIMAALPNIFAAIVIVSLTFFIMRFIANVVSGLLENTGVNEIPSKIGLEDVFAQTKISDLIGHVIIFFAMLFAVIEAANILGFGRMSSILHSFIAFGGDIMLGAIILMIGFWLANTVSAIVERGESGSVWLATLVRMVIMGLVFAMGLRAMNVANEIVILAFTLTLGAAAVAFALAFGLGGQGAAARLLKDKLDDIDKTKE